MGTARDSFQIRSDHRPEVLASFGLDGHERPLSASYAQEHRISAPAAPELVERGQDLRVDGGHVQPGKQHRRIEQRHQLIRHARSPMSEPGFGQLLGREAVLPLLGATTGWTRLEPLVDGEDALAVDAHDHHVLWLVVGTTRAAIGSIVGRSKRTTKCTSHLGTLLPVTRVARITRGGRSAPTLRCATLATCPPESPGPAHWRPPLLRHHPVRLHERLPEPEVARARAARSRRQCRARKEARRSSARPRPSRLGRVRARAGSGSARWPCPACRGAGRCRRPASWSASRWPRGAGAGRRARRGS